MILINGFYNKKNFRRNTLTSHLGRDPQAHAGLVNMPVYRGSTVLFDDVATYEGRDPNDYKVMRYGIYGTPTTFALEAAVAKLEGGDKAVALPSGLAAITAAVRRYPRRPTVAVWIAIIAATYVGGASAFPSSSSGTRTTRSTCRAKINEPPLGFGGRLVIRLKSMASSGHPAN